MDEGLEAVLLVAGQRLRREEVERPGGGLGGEAAQDRGVEAEGFAAGSWGRDEDVTVRQGCVDRLRLVGIKARDAAFFQRGAKVLGKAVGDGAIFRRGAGDRAIGRQAGTNLAGCEPGVYDGFQPEGLGPRRCDHGWDTKRMCGVRKATFGAG